MGGIDSLHFPCRRKSDVWYNVSTDEAVLVHPTSLADLATLDGHLDAVLPASSLSACRTASRTPASPRLNLGPRRRSRSASERRSDGRHRSLSHVPVFLELMPGVSPGSRARQISPSHVREIAPAQPHRGFRGLK
jgi:hypothetical protein